MTGTWDGLNTGRGFAALLAPTVALVVAACALSVWFDDPGHETASVEEAEEHEGRAPTEIELTPAVEAAFSEESYRPGDDARLVVFNAATGLTLQVFRVGPERKRTVGNVTMEGVAITRPRHVGSSDGRLVVPIAVGDWPSGLYFARLGAADGRVGFAPFVVRARPYRRAPRRDRASHADLAGVQPPRRRSATGRATRGTRAGSTAPSASADPSSTAAFRATSAATTFRSSPGSLEQVETSTSSPSRTSRSPARANWPARTT